MKKLILTAVILTIYNVANADFYSVHTIVGTVTRVLDGDTLTVKTKTKNVTVRLSRIDAPEISHYGKPAQPYGKEAGDYLREVVKGEKVVVYDEGTDKYGRMIGTVMMGNENINALMVEDGYAWVYDQYAQDVQGAGLNELESVAREKKKGLWIDANPIYPAEFRKSQK
ncbi:MAG: thermonuclease family protein [Methylococcaceae bacterium]